MVKKNAQPGFGYTMTMRYNTLSILLYVNTPYLAVADGHYLLPQGIQGLYIHLQVR